MKQVDCYFTPISVWAYFGAERFQRLADNIAISAIWKPVRIAQVFAASGALPLGQRPPSRQANRLQEIQRWSQFLGQPVNLHPRHFPVDPTLACLFITAAIQSGEDRGLLARACLSACWRDERNIADVDVLVAIANEQGLNGADLMRMTSADSVSRQLDDWTEEGIARGVIGSPCFVVDDQVFFGQDRLDFLERYLVGSA